MNVLIIAPHPDDEAIGCGGAICLHTQRSDHVEVVFLTSGELGLKHLPQQAAWNIREEEARQAGHILGIARLHFLRLPDWFVSENIAAGAGQVSNVLETLRPELIYQPHSLDEHPDHHAAGEVLTSALSRAGVQAVNRRHYELWSPLAKFDELEDITGVMARKLRAIRCYGSQLTEFRYDQAIRGLNRYRGELSAKCRFAEVFASHL
jgi:LmbE family N-acetylglucosaminyl deacetylase